MFSGIIEKSCKVLSFALIKPSIYRMVLEKPDSFTDLKSGDSVCINGVCLTLVDSLEKEAKATMSFDVAYETLKVTGWDTKKMLSQIVNVERSLSYGDRVHGHFLSGHVDALAEVFDIYMEGESKILKIKLPEGAQKFVWPKGSIGISGVSLTVNYFVDNIAEVCLIPETLKRTNLGQFKTADPINIEYDWMAKAVYNQALSPNGNRIDNPIADQKEVEQRPL